MPNNGRTIVSKASYLRVQALAAAAVVVWLILAGFSEARAAGYPLTIQPVKDTDGAWEIIAHNQGGVPVFVRIDIKNGVNVRASNTSTGLQKVLEPGAKDSMMVVIPADPNKEMSFGWETKMVLGRGTARGEHDGIYRVPFPGDLTFETLNTADDSHAHVNEAHTFDIIMPEGTPVIAARSGVVADVKGEARGDRVANGMRPVYESKEDADRMGNYIRIMHEDGTIAEYRHLQDASVMVRTGQRVEAGTQIALSGNSGKSRVPHLHFGVLKPQQFFNPPISVPVRMDMAGRGVLDARAGMAIGAAASVTTGAEVTRRDPLVLGKVSREGAPTLNRSEAVDVASGTMRSRSLVLYAGTSVLVLILVSGGLIAWRAKKSGGLKGLVRLKRSKALGTVGGEAARQIEQDQHGAQQAPGLAGRPKKGYLFTEEEESFRQSLSIGLPLNYAVHAKVSLHRLLPRPPIALENAHAYALLRGESIDYMLVSNVDGRIAVAIDVHLDATLVDETWSTARRIKQEMLKKAGIHYITMPAQTGPNELRNVIEAFTPRGYMATGTA